MCRNSKVAIGHYWKESDNQTGIIMTFYSWFMTLGETMFSVHLAAVLIYVCMFTPMLINNGAALLLLLFLI